MPFSEAWTKPNATPLQSGGLGDWGPEFKSRRSDQHHSESADLSQLCETPSELGSLRVHKGVHKRVVRMVTLRQDSRGNYSARKRLPDDVREEYGRLYGPRLEAKFSASASDGPQEAKRQFHEWQTEVGGRIDAIRAERTGDGIALTPRQARALAGEWYEWFITRHPISDQQKWKDVRDQVHEALREAVGDDEWERNDPDDLWREDEELRKAVRSVLADVGETAQFLAMKGQTLNGEALGSFPFSPRSAT